MVSLRIAAGQAAPVAGCDASSCLESRRQTMKKNFLPGILASSRRCWPRDLSGRPLRSALQFGKPVRRHDPQSGHPQPGRCPGRNHQRQRRHHVQGSRHLLRDGRRSGRQQRRQRQGNGPLVDAAERPGRRNSNTEQTIVDGFTAVLVCQGVAEIKAGDKLELVFSVSKPGEGTGSDRLEAQGRAGRPQHDLLGVQGGRLLLCPVVEQRHADRRMRPASRSRSIRPTRPRKSKTTRALSPSRRPEPTS